MIPILLIFLGYFLFGLLPLFVGSLNSAGYSSFGIAFSRFIWASLLELIVVLIAILIMQRRLMKKGIHKSYGETFKEIFHNYFWNKNPEFMGGRPQIIFLVFLGIVVACGTNVLYFVSFKLAGVAVSTIVINGTVFMFITILNTWKKEEDFDLLKGIYLALLVGAVIIIGYSKEGSGNGSYDLFSIIIIIFTVFSFLILTEGLGRDKSLQRNPLFTNFRLALLPNSHDVLGVALLIKAMLKNLGIHFFGSLFLFPFALFSGLLFPNTLLGQQAILFYTFDLPHFWQMSAEPMMLILVIVITLLPYFVLNYAAIIWPKGKYGSNDMWISVSKMVQPLLGLYIGYFYFIEAIRPDYMAITTLLLIATIFIRYFHLTTNILRAVFVLKMGHPHQNNDIVNFLMGIREIEQINVLAGTYDIIATVTVHSVKRLGELEKILKFSPDIDSVTYSTNPPLDFHTINQQKLKRWLLKHP